MSDKGAEGPWWGVPTAHTSVRDALRWLDAEIEDRHYGEVGLIFTIHADRITRIERIDRRTMVVDKPPV